MTKVETTIRRLDRFMEGWISNPAAQLEFVRLIKEVHCLVPGHAHDDALIAWIAEGERTAKYLGVS